MERGKRTIFAVLIAGIIVAAVLSSFALNLFDRSGYEIQLADLSGAAQSGSPESGEDPGGRLVRVEVTPETVQSVVATLSRPQSYYRELTVELWSDALVQSAAAVQVWVDGGWTRSDVAAPNGTVQHNLVGEGTRWIWYDGGEAVSFPADGAQADLAQRIPTYEDVLELSQAEIAGAGYEVYGGIDCVFVEAEQRELGSTERYWISVADGLLVAAERVKGDALVYRMAAQSPEIPAPQSSSFALPDGTVCHTVGEGE